MLNISYPQIDILINCLIIPCLEERQTLRMNPDHIPDLHWRLANTYHTTSIGYTELMSTTVSVHYVTVETNNDAKITNVGEWCGTVLNTKTSTSQSKQNPTICSIIPITKI